MKIFRIKKETANDCGGFRPPKGHLDTQMFPECAGTETDRNIVKKTVDKRKKRKNKKKASIDIEAKHSYPISDSGSKKGLWTQWKEKIIDDKKFVEILLKHAKLFLPYLSKDPVVRGGVVKALNDFRVNKDYAQTARQISSFLSMGKDVDESVFGNNSKGENMIISKKKKKKWNPNPWAVCNTTVDKDKNPEKFERCVKKVKKQQAFNLKEYRLAQVKV